MRSPKLIKLFLIIPIYPILYYGWVSQIKNTWIDNDLKDLHPEILYPERQRYTWKHVGYDMDAEFEDCLKFQRKGLREEYAKRLKMNTL